MQNPTTTPVVLASSSSYRRKLLNRLLDNFVTIPPNVDESNDGTELPEHFTKRLARQKAETVSISHYDSLIIGADQIAVLDDQIIGKPNDHQSAIEQLLAASGKSLQFLTTVCVLEPVGQMQHEHIDRTTVLFQKFDLKLAEAYLKHDKPYDCTGSFKIEGAGFVLFESVQTNDPTALIGLPMIWLAGTLRKLGYLLP
jgi:septum formation protein